MKKVKLLLVLITIYLCPISFTQTTYQIVKIDSITKNKNEIYAITKMYIAETWKSSQDVIQNDDKDAGIILVKGLNIQHLVFQMNDHIWTFAYTVKFTFKDNKYRIVIDNIYNQSARCLTYEWPHLLISDTYPGFKATAINEERYFIIMNALKTELQNIVYRYEKYLKTSSISTEEW